MDKVQKTQDTYYVDWSKEKDFEAIEDDEPLQQEEDFDEDDDLIMDEAIQDEDEESVDLAG